MSWLDRYRRASFRGVPFRVERHAAAGGRRLVAHEYPGRDRPATEDLGRARRTWSLEAYVVGEDYDQDRARLIAALEQQGPGELVHPYLGTLEVAVESWQLTESRDEQRLARLTLTLVEPGEVLEPVGGRSAQAAATGAAGDLVGAAKGAYPGKLALLGRPGVVLAAITKAAQAAEDYIGGLAFTSSGSPLAQLLDATEGLADQAVTLATDPASLADALASPVQRIRFGFTSRLEALRALDGIHGLPDPVPAGTGAVQQEAAANGSATVLLLRQVALAEQVDLAALLEYESREQADERRAQLEARADELAGLLADDELLALEGLLEALRAAVPPPGAALPSLARLTPPATVPALVLAHQLYRDRGRGDAIAARNRIARPGFLPGGAELEVLNG